MHHRLIASVYKKYHRESPLFVSDSKLSPYQSHAPENSPNTVDFHFTSFPWGVLSSFSQKGRSPAAQNGNLLLHVLIPLQTVPLIKITEESDRDLL